MPNPRIIDIKSEGRILLIKAKFRTDSGRQHLFGQLFIILTNMEALKNYHAIISHRNETYDMELHANWDKYEEFIVECKWKGLFSLNMTNLLNIHLEKFKTDRNLYKSLYQHTVNRDYNKLDIMLYGLISQVLHEKNIRIESIIQEISAKEYIDVLKTRSKPVETVLQPSSTDSKKTDDFVILKVKPVLAPVTGKPVYMLKLDDTIMVKILPDPANQEEYTEIFKSKENGVIRSIPAGVIDIKYGSGKNNPCEILVKIDDNIFGKIVEDERHIKLKIYDPKTDNAGGISGYNARMKTYSKSKGDDKATKIFILILSVFLTIFAIAIAYILMH